MVLTALAGGLLGAWLLAAPPGAATGASHRLAERMTEPITRPILRRTHGPRFVVAPYGRVFGAQDGLR
jgi:hypothetical protein